MKMLPRDQVIFTTNPNIVYQTYNPREILGKGTFSVVEKVRNQDGIDVAMKVVNLNDDNFRSFLPEILSRRLGPNPFCVYPQNISCEQIANSTDVRMILEYEMYDGDLFSFVQKFEETDEMLIDIILKFYDYLVQGVYFLVENGIYHGDIKPENILVKRVVIGNEIGYQVRFGDFGISNQIPCFSPPARDYRITPSGGTPEYVPPEQLTGQVYTGASMFYSLAMTVFYCLIGNEEQMENNWKLPMRGRQPFSFNQIYQKCTDEQRRTLIQIETLLNIQPSLRMFNLPQKRDIVFRINYQPQYCSLGEIYQRTKDFFPGLNPYEAIRVFLFQIYQVVVKQRPFRMGIVQYIGVIDCLSRYLKTHPFTPLAADIIIALFRTEMYRCSLYVEGYPQGVTADALRIIHSLEYRLFDCNLTSSFFCFKNEPVLTQDHFFNTNLNFPAVFENPYVRLPELIMTLDPEGLGLACNEPVAFEHLRPNPDRYWQIDS